MFSSSPVRLLSTDFQTSSMYGEMFYGCHTALSPAVVKIDSKRITI